MTIVSTHHAIWLWPSTAALVFGGAAALASAQAEGAEVLARVLAAIGAGIAVSLVALLLTAMLRSRGRAGSDDATRRARTPGAKTGGS